MKEMIIQLVQLAFKKRALLTVLCTDGLGMVLVYFVGLTASDKFIVRLEKGTFLSVLYIYLVLLLFSLVCAIAFRRGAQPDWDPESQSKRIPYRLLDAFVIATPSTAILLDVLDRGMVPIRSLIKSGSDQAVKWSIYAVIAVATAFLIFLQFLLAKITERQRTVEHIEPDLTVRCVMATGKVLCSLHPEIYTVSVPKKHNSAMLDRLIALGVLRPETEKAEKTHPERRYVFYSIHKQYYDQLKYSAPSATESKNQKEGDDLLADHGHPNDPLSKQRATESDSEYHFGLRTCAERSKTDRELVR